MPSLRATISGERAVFAPLVLNPLMAKMAAKAGFEALYLGGGATGYAKVSLEANLSLTEMAQAGIEIRSEVDLPLILDGAAGWGDPMHIRRTIGMAEAAGFAAIEIEDQLLPKRAHHHIGIEHMVPMELMAEKVRVAVETRRSDDFVIVARSNGVRASNMDDALRRAEAYRAAGADVLLLSPRNAEEARHIGERLGPPLMYLCKPGGLASIGLDVADMERIGFRIIADPQTALLAAYETLKGVYAELADGWRIGSRSEHDWEALQDDLHGTIDLERLLTIERRSVEKG